MLRAGGCYRERRPDTAQNAPHHTPSTASAAPVLLQNKAPSASHSVHSVIHMGATQMNTHKFAHWQLSHPPAPNSNMGFSHLFHLPSFPRLTPTSTTPRSIHPSFGPRSAPSSIFLFFPSFYSTVSFVPQKLAISSPGRQIITGTPLKTQHRPKTISPPHPGDSRSIDTPNQWSKSQPQDMNPSSPPVASSPTPARSLSVRATASTRISSSFSPPANLTLSQHPNTSANTHTATATATHKQASPSPKNKASSTSNVKTPPNHSNSSQHQQHLHQQQKLQTSPSSPSHPQPRIVYGKGAIARLPAELGFLCITSPIIVSSPSRLALARRVQALIPNLNSHILDSAVINVPDRVVDDAVERISGRDAVISVGGSSAVGLARAISIRKGIPHICIPTTYSGFEVMPLFEEDAASLAGNAGSIAPARSNSSKQSSSKNSNGKRTTGGSSSKHSGTRTTTGSRASSKRSVTIRDARSRIKPAVIIYDEELTALSSNRILAPTEEIILPINSVPRSRRFSADDAEWSFLQLP